MVFKLMRNNIASKTETKDRKPKAIYIYLPMFQTEPNHPKYLAVVNVPVYLSRMSWSSEPPLSCFWWSKAQVGT